MELFILIAIYTIGFWCAFGFSAGSCEYRDYNGGHRFVKAFYAKSRYQMLLVKFQAKKDIAPENWNKITYIGYVSSIITNIVMLCILCVSIWLLKREDFNSAFYFYIYGTLGCIIFNLIGFLFQIIDSFINRIFPK